MVKEMSRKASVLLIITLMLSSISVMTDMVIVPIIGSWYEMFGDQIFLVDFAVSGPVLLMVCSALLTGKLMQIISKKKLLVGAMMLFCVSSILGAAIESILYIAIMRALVGFSYGVIMVSAMALISELFVDEKKRSIMLGLYNAGGAGIGAIIGVVSGFLATSSWQSVFIIYWISIPILVMMFFFIPLTPPEGTTDHDESFTENESIPLLSFAALCFSWIVFGIVYSIIFYQIALYIIENAIGDTSMVGIMASLGTVGSVIASLLFGFTYSKINRGTSTLIYLILAIAYFVLYLTQNVMTTAAASVFMGFTMGNAANYYVMRATTIVPPKKISKAISIVSASGSIGMFLSTYFSTFLQNFLGVQTLTAILPVLAGIMGVGTLLSIVLILLAKRKPATKMSAEL